MRSVVGRFLEHHRIFYFQADGADKLYLSSADWMERNFFKRIEVAFPILDPKVKRRVMKEGLRPYLGDNCQAWELDGDNHYAARTPHTRRAAQEILLKGSPAHARLNIDHRPHAPPFRPPGARGAGRRW